MSDTAGRGGALCLPALPALVGGDLTGMRGPTATSHWVVPGRVLCGGFPGNIHGPTHERNVQALLQCRMDTLVCLLDVFQPSKPVSSGTLPNFLPELQACADYEISFVQLPVADGEMAKDADLLQILKQVLDALVMGSNVYIFDLGGHGCAGVLSALLLGKLYSLDPYNALTRIQRYHDQRDEGSEHPTPMDHDQRMQVYQLLPRSIPRIDEVASQFDFEAEEDHLPHPKEEPEVWAKIGFQVSDERSQVKRGGSEPEVTSLEPPTTPSNLKNSPAGKHLLGLSARRTAPGASEKDLHHDGVDREESSPFVDGRHWYGRQKLQLEDQTPRKGAGYSAAPFGNELTATQSRLAGSSPSSSKLQSDAPFAIDPYEKPLARTSNAERHSSVKIPPPNRSVPPGGLSPLPDTRHCENVVRGPTDTSYWLIPGQALVGAFPGSLDFSAEEADLISLLSAGVTVFASLQKEFHFAEEGPSSSPSASPRLGRRRMNSPRYTFSNYSKHASSLADYPLSFVEFPLKKDDFRCEQDLARAVVDLANLILEGECVYIHCESGQGRSGIVAPLLLARLYDINVTDALNRVEHYNNTRRKGGDEPTPSNHDERMLVYRAWGVLEKH